MSDGCLNHGFAGLADGTDVANPPETTSVESDNLWQSVIQTANVAHPESPDWFGWGQSLSSLRSRGS